MTNRDVKDARQATGTTVKLVDVISNNAKSMISAITSAKSAKMATGLVAHSVKLSLSVALSITKSPVTSVNLNSLEVSVNIGSVAVWTSKNQKILVLSVKTCIGLMKGAAGHLLTIVLSMTRGKLTSVLGVRTVIS